MATQKLNLTRDQLATFLKNHEQIKQFERLFEVVDQVSPSADTQGIEILAENAQASATEALAQLILLARDSAINSGSAENKAQQALDALNRIANAVELAALAPALQSNNSVVTDYIDLPEDGPHVTQERRVQWNRDDGTMDVGLYGGSVLQVGQETMYYAKNTSGALIPNGTPVMFTGTVGASGKLTFGLAVADGSVPADYMMGVATQDIASNGFGYVTSFGLVRGFNTSGSPYGETWVDGDLLYFGAVAPGTWTKVPPIAPRIDVPVAVVINAATGGAGSIFVRMTVAESLARLQDVYISGLADKDVLIYDSANLRWENKPQTSLSVGTATNLAGGAVGSVPYQTAASTTGFLALGAAYRYMRVNPGATAPEWATFTAGTAINLANGVGGLTITNTAPDQVVSLTGAGTTSISGTYPNFTITSNDAFTGTVTSVSVNLGTTGTDVSFSVANPSTTPAITLNIPTASAANRGALSSTDWSTFNAKVSGPASATDNALARFDATTGKIIQNSVATLSDAGALAGLTQLDVDNIRVDGNVISSTNANGDIDLQPNGTGVVDSTGSFRTTKQVQFGTSGVVSNAKTGSDTIGTTIQSFTFTFDATKTFAMAMVEVQFTAQQGFIAPGFAVNAKKWIFSLRRYASAITATTLNSEADSSVVINNSNYGITLTPSVTIVSSTEARFDVAVTNSGALSVAGFDYVTQATVISTQPITVT